MKVEVPLNELALFAGAGGGILGGHLLGWQTVCAVERDAYAAQVLVARQNDGALRPFPIWSDVCSFDGCQWRGLVDVVSGGFPCQDISAAGKGGGLDGERSGLWREMARIVGDVRPEWVFVENSPVLTSRGLGVVLGDLAALGFDAAWQVLSAADVGAPHLRERIWIVAHADSLAGHEGGACDATEGQTWRDANRGGKRGLVADSARLQPGRSKQWPERQRVGPSSESEFDEARPIHHSDCGRHRPPEGEICTGRDCIERADWWLSEPDVGRVANAVASRVDRLKAIGNGQVPLVAATAFRALATEISRVR